jgi:hypothetical protein
LHKTIIPRYIVHDTRRCKVDRRQWGHPFTDVDVLLGLVENVRDGRMKNLYACQKLYGKNQWAAWDLDDDDDH